MLKQYAATIFSSWMQQNQEAVMELLEESESLLDLGCGNGELTELFATKVMPHKIMGVDAIGTNKKFEIIHSDLNRKLPFADESFGSVMSHYVVEHLYNTGLFISETHRVLKKGGYAIVATDNLSAWPNILSLILGFQPFSSTNGIAQEAIGNPLALRSVVGNIQDSPLNAYWRSSGEYAHSKVLAYQALIDAYKKYGFHIERIIGIGYFPFGGKISTFFANIDTRHAHFLILKVRK